MIYVPNLATLSAANNSFGGIVSRSKKVSRVTASVLTASNAGFATIDGKLTEKTIVGYTPTGWTGAAANLNITFNTVGSVDNNLLLPTGVVVTQISAKNVTSLKIEGAVTGEITGAVGAVISVGNGTVVPVIADTLLNSVTLPEVNSGVMTKISMPTPGKQPVIAANQFVSAVSVGAITPVDKIGVKVSITYVVLV